MTDGFGAIITKDTKDTETLERKNYMSDLENKPRLRSQLGVASCSGGSEADRIARFQMDDEDIPDKQF